MKKILNPSQYYDLESHQKDEYVKKVYQHIENSNNPLLKNMLLICNNKINNYKTDFFIHDFYTLTQQKETFLWMVRKSGTNLIQLDDPTCEKDNWKWYNWFNAIEKNMKTEFYFLIDNKNKTIKKITEKKAIHLINKKNETYYSNLNII